MGSAKDPEQYTRLTRLAWDWWGDSFVAIIVIALALIALVKLWENTLGRLPWL
jgi:hypothetical protein